jgi:hypothetical protein
MTLSPAWGGSAQEMLRFAREAVSRAPDGDPMPALLPLAHLEQVAAERSPMSRGGWFSDEALRECERSGPFRCGGSGKGVATVLFCASNVSRNALHVTL